MDAVDSTEKLIHPSRMGGQGGSTIASAEDNLVGGGMASILALNDSRPLAPLAVVLHVSLNYVRYSGCLLYSEGEVLAMCLHLE